MSMNLQCEELELPQIGSWASHLILSANDKGEPDGGWWGVDRRLRFYWSMCRQDAFNAEAGNAEQQEVVNSYYNNLFKALDEAQGPLHFSIS